jgi:hypothetical protein
VLSTLGDGGKLIDKKKLFFEQYCDYSVTPANYLSVIGGIAPSSEEWRTVCFAGGSTFKQPLVLKNYENIILKGAGTPHSWLQGTRTTNPSDPTAYAMLDIRGGRNIVVSGLRIENLKQFVSSASDPYSEVSRAISTQDVKYLHIRNCAVYSHGKQTAKLTGNSGTPRNVHIQGSIISGSYFVIDAVSSNVLCEGSHLIQDMRNVAPGDVHSLVFTGTANHLYRNVVATAYTGQSFVSGVNTSHNNIRIENISFAQAGLKSWMQIHPNYKYLRLHLYGSYPKGVTTYFYNPFQGGGASPGSKVYYH